jgi:hypothetical protein
MSRRKKNEEPEDRPGDGPILDLHMFVIHGSSSGGPGGGSCRGDHDGMIRYWESLRGILTEQFGAEIADGVIKLQHLAKAACAGGHRGLARLLTAVSSLLAASGGDEDAMSAGAAKLGHLADQVQIVRHIKEIAESFLGDIAAAAKAAKGPSAKAKAAAKAKARAEAAGSNGYVMPKPSDN